MCAMEEARGAWAGSIVVTLRTQAGTRLGEAAVEPVAPGRELLR